MHTSKPPRRLPVVGGSLYVVDPTCAWSWNQALARAWGAAVHARGAELVAVVVALVDVVRIGLVVAGLPDPLAAVPDTAARDPVVARHRVVVLDDQRRAPVVVEVALADDRPRHVDRPAVDVAITGPLMDDHPAAAVPVAMIVATIVVTIADHD